MAFSQMSSQVSEDRAMAIYNFTISYSTFDNTEFAEALQWASIKHHILTVDDFLEFMAWWYSRNDFRNNIYKNSSYGVILQFQSLLTMDESYYVDYSGTPWFGGTTLRTFLNDLIRNFGEPVTRSHSFLPVTLQQDRSSSRDVSEDVAMAIYNFVMSYSLVDNDEFAEALKLASQMHDILTVNDFLEFMAWWMSRNDFRNSIYGNSSYGVILQYQGVLSQEDSDYIDDRSAPWFGGTTLRSLLRDLIHNFS